MRKLLAVSLFLLLPWSACHAHQQPLPVPPSGVIGVTTNELSPDFWVARAPHGDKILMNPGEIGNQNARLFAQDASMHDLAEIPHTLDAATVRGWIKDLSERPDYALYDVHGKRVSDAALDAIVARLALDAIPESQQTRYGLVVHRAALRRFPTTLRVFSDQGNADIDRFQESAIFPGTPVVIAHTSAGDKWLFVVSPRYAAWVQADAVAAGSRKTVLGYPSRTPYRVITGDDVATVFTREQPALSELALDMGVRVPLATGLDPAAPVNGQTAYSSWTLALPLRGADGKLEIAPALLQKVEDSAADYLPLTRANIIRQAFKFLGERYGWGHAYHGRDCSGFVSDVYRSMGVIMPRNTSDQGVSPALEHIQFDADSSHAERVQAVADLDIGDLVYIPGHVLMMIGKAHGRHYMIHDVTGMSYRQADGSLRRVKLNAVSVTPLEPLMYNAQDSYIDRMTSIVHIY